MNNKITRGNKGMKTLAALPLATALLLGASVQAIPAAGNAAYAAEAVPADFKLQTLDVVIGGRAISVPGGVMSGQTYVGLAFLSKELGLTAGWDAKTKIISVGGKSKKLSMKPVDGVYQYDVNGHILGYGAEQPVIVKGTTYLPLRFLLEQMDYEIGYDTAKKRVTIKEAARNPLTFANRSLDQTKDKVEMTIQYPQLQGFADAEVQSKINALLAAEGKAYETAGLSFVKDFGGAQWDGEYPLTYDVNYTVTKNDGGLLSLHFDVYTYSGGAHGMYDLQSHTYDLKTGKELTLQEAAGGNANYIAIVNEEIKRQIESTDLPLIEPFTTIDADQRYYLRGDALVVYFSLYEYTPYAAGIPEFVIPLSKFK
ncbi:stalk domain-containing protein [Paenibacillus methanolicus]|uniref:Inhibitor of cysteine peptidase n=1 Tax=Paenibacillus methanolicus TaxID=582686 RepID=A0A5S5BUX1_9BACL|nr:stalk domain-containing protein [Paenibacillus methanolicus]TYP70116.1 inhibitor of cysteine peptidase [Paenibacillus methanolicus]